MPSGPTGAPLADSAPAIVLEDVWKRYKRVARFNPVPVPFGPGSRRRDRREDLSDIEDEMDDDVGEEGEEEEEVGDERIVTAVRDMSLEVPAGAALGLIGTNGSGKTTLLKLLARLTPPTEGRITVRGRVAPMLEFATMFMNQEVTGRRNVLILAELFGVPRAFAEERMDAVIRFAELEGHANALAKTYSGGLYKRLAFSAVLNLEPDILLVDEVLGVGDSAFSQRCFEAVCDASRNGLTVVYASHDMPAVATLCEEVVWMEEGSIVDRGDPGDVIAAYERANGGRAPQGAKAGGGSHDLLDPKLRKPGPHVNERAAILGAGIFTMDGEPTEFLRADEDAIVEVVFQVFEAGSMMRPAVVFALEKGAVRLRAVRNDPFEMAEPGVYVASVHVPPGSLAAGAYEPRVGARILAGGEWSPVLLRGAFRFEVEDPREGDPVDTIEDDETLVADSDDGPPAIAELEWLLTHVADASPPR